MGILSYQRVAFVAALWLVGAALATNAIWMGAPQIFSSRRTSVAPAPAKPAAFVPHTVVLKETLSRGQSKPEKPGSEYVRAVRADGSFVTFIRRLGDSKTAVLQRRITFADGQVVAADDVASTSTRWAAPPGQDITSQRDPASGCQRTRSGRIGAKNQVVHGDEVIGGYRATKITIGDNTLWYALDIGCAVIRAKWDRGATSNSKELASVVFGEPDISFFTVPEAYSKLPFQEFFKIPEKVAK